MARTIKELIDLVGNVSEIYDGILRTANGEFAEVSNLIQDTKDFGKYVSLVAFEPDNPVLGNKFDGSYTFVKDRFDGDLNATVLTDVTAEADAARDSDSRYQTLTYNVQTLADARSAINVRTDWDIHSQVRKYAVSDSPYYSSGGLDVPQNVALKSMQNYDVTADDTGLRAKALSRQELLLESGALQQGNLGIFSSFKTDRYSRANVPYLVNRLLPSLQILAKTNPRFNRFINPLYYTGYSSVPDGPFMDEFFDADDTTRIDGKNAAIAQSIADSGDSVLSDITRYAVPGSDRYGINSYENLFVMPTDPATYLDSLGANFSRKTDSFLGGLVDDAITKLDDRIPNINKIMSKTVGINLAGLAGAATNDIIGLSTNSENRIYGARHGIAIGQTMGSLFKTQLQGFYNSDSSKLDDSFFAQAADFLKKAIGQGGTGGFLSRGVFPNLNYEDRGIWYLPVSNPAIYTLDERQRYGFYGKPEDRSILDKLVNLYNSLSFDVGSFFSHSSLPRLGQSATDFFANLDKTINTGANLLNDAAAGGTDIVRTTVDAITGRFLGEPSTPHFAPESAFKNDPNSWDPTLDTVLGGDAQRAKYPEIQLDRHRIYIQNTPYFQTGEWFIVDQDAEFNQNTGFFSEYARTITSTTNTLNIKPSKLGDLLQIKQDALESLNLQEAVQQPDGSSNGNSYDPSSPFQPKFAMGNLSDASYALNTTQEKIGELLDDRYETRRDFSDFSASDLAQSEPQFFPFYFRTVGRSDSAVVQQPIYDNGKVYMSKRRITGNSVVMFDATMKIDTDSLNVQIGQDTYLGRPDPVMMYGGTTRSFGFSFTIPIARPQDMIAQRAKMNALMQMTYPELMALNDIGVFGYRKPPVVELRIGDQFWYYGMIESLSMRWGGENGLWETLPGGRFMRGCDVQVTFKIMNREQPGVHTDFFSPTFKEEIFSNAGQPTVPSKNAFPALGGTSQTQPEGGFPSAPLSDFITP